MGSIDRGFIVTHYVDYNGSEWTRDQLVERIESVLSEGGMTAGELSRRLKIKQASLYNVLGYMMENKNLTKFKSDNRVNVYRKVKECLLADLFIPTPEQIEKNFKVKSRKIHKTEQGSSKSSGRGGINPYAESYLSSVYWGGE